MGSWSTGASEVGASGTDGTSGVEVGVRDASWVDLASGAEDGAVPRPPNGEAA
ncbi:hypothetical protein JCM14720_02110 [Calditerricola yamamurae]